MASPPIERAKLRLFSALQASEGDSFKTFSLSGAVVAAYEHGEAQIKRIVEELLPNFGRPLRPSGGSRFVDADGQFFELHLGKVIAEPWTYGCGIIPYGS